MEQRVIAMGLALEERMQNWETMFQSQKAKLKQEQEKLSSSKKHVKQLKKEYTIKVKQLTKGLAELELAKKKTNQFLNDRQLRQSDDHGGLSTGRWALGDLQDQFDIKEKQLADIGVELQDKQKQVEEIEDRLLSRQSQVADLEVVLASRRNELAQLETWPRPLGKDASLTTTNKKEPSSATNNHTPPSNPVVAAIPKQSPHVEAKVDDVHRKTKPLWMTDHREIVALKCANQRLLRKLETMDSEQARKSPTSAATTYRQAADKLKHATERNQLAYEKLQATQTLLERVVEETLLAGGKDHEESKLSDIVHAVPEAASSSPPVHEGISHSRETPPSDGDLHIPPTNDHAKQGVVKHGIVLRKVDSFNEHEPKWESLYAAIHEDFGLGLFENEFKYYITSGDWYTILDNPYSGYTMAQLPTENRATLDITVIDDEERRAHKFHFRGSTQAETLAWAASLKGVVPVLPRVMETANV